VGGGRSKKVFENKGSNMSERRGSSGEYVAKNGTRGRRGNLLKQRHSQRGVEKKKLVGPVVTGNINRKNKKIKKCRNEVVRRKGHSE